MDPMPSALPDGEPMPEDGALPAHALAGAAERPLGFYLHVPYCATRCGYCDFNTYTASELRGSGGALASRDNYADHVVDEIRLARKVLGDDPRPGRDGLRRRRHAHAAARRRPRTDAGGDPRGVRPRAGRGDHHRGQPGVRRPALPRRAAGGRLQPRLLRHAERAAARAEGPRPHAHPGPPRGLCRRGPRGRLRPRQPRPDLRHARARATTTGGPRSTRRSAPGPTTSRRTR